LLSGLPCPSNAWWRTKLTIGQALPGPVGSDFDRPTRLGAQTCPISGVLEFLTTSSSQVGPNLLKKNIFATNGTMAVSEFFTHWRGRPGQQPVEKSQLQFRIAKPRVSEFLTPQSKKIDRLTTSI
jgi:hypothetical protein